MFERWFINRRKKKILRKIEKAKTLLRKNKTNKTKKAEKIYKDLLLDYSKFCKKAGHVEKLSVYHRLLYLYEMLEKRDLKERKPAAVKAKAGIKRTKRKTRKKKAKKRAKKRSIKRRKTRKKKGRKKALKKRSRKGKARKKKAKKRAKKRRSKKRKAKKKSRKIKIKKKELKKKEKVKKAEKIIEENIVLKEEEKKPAEPVKAVKTTRFRTSLDDLYLYIEEKGSVSVQKAASRLKTSSEKIEEWAKILGDHHLITIYYPAFAGTQLRSLNWEQGKKKREKPKKKPKEKEKK